MKLSPQAEILQKEMVTATGDLGGIAEDTDCIRQVLTNWSYGKGTEPMGLLAQSCKLKQGQGLENRRYIRHLLSCAALF